MIIADTVNNQVYEIIKNMILERQLKPGERIDPKIIAQDYNISLMPVRNALQQLTTQGLVVTLQRVGFFVKQFTSQELLEIIDTREMFELYCLDRFFHNIDPKEAEALFVKLNDTPDSQIKELQDLDGQVHQITVDASHNTFLLAQYANLKCLFNMGIYLAEKNIVTAKKEHICIVENIYKGKKENSIVFLKQHLERVSQEIIQYNMCRT